LRKLPKRRRNRGDTDETGGTVGGADSRGIFQESGEAKRTLAIKGVNYGLAKMVVVNSVAASYGRCSGGP